MLLGTAETRPNKTIDWMEHRSVPSTIRSRKQLQPSPLSIPAILALLNFAHLSSGSSPSLSCRTERSYRD